MEKTAIVIPSYKRPDGLQATIQDIWDMYRYPIFVVHSYPEGTELPRGVTYIKQRPGTRGPAVAVNQGMEEALKHGFEYIIRVDDDIRFNKSKFNVIQTFVNALEANPHVGIVSAWNRSLAWRQRTQPKLARMTNPAQCVGFRAKALKEVGLFDENFLTREDTELTIRHFIAGWESAVVDPTVTFDHVAGAYTADSTFAQDRNDGVEVKMCNQLAAKYPFVRVSAHPKRQDLRRVSYIPGLKKMGILGEFSWNDYELASRGS